MTFSFRLYFPKNSHLVVILYIKMNFLENKELLSGSIKMVKAYDEIDNNWARNSTNSFETHFQEKSLIVERTVCKMLHIYSVLFCSAFLISFVGIYWVSRSKSWLLFLFCSECAATFVIKRCAAL